MTRKEIIKDLQTIADYFVEQSGGTVPIAIEEAINILDTYGAQWIPCKKKLPKRETRVLICSNKGVVMESKFVHYVDGGDSWVVSCFMPYDEVIAWMPLPEPYEEVEE